jgi:acetyltransferase-like isoleucine patch superfamily enzyme
MNSLLARFLASPTVRYYRDLFSTLRQGGVSNGARILPGGNVSNSAMEYGSSLGHDAVLINSRLGRYSYISKGARVANADIGPFCSIGIDAVIAPGFHPINGVSTHPIFFSAGGQAATVWRGTTIAEENDRVQIGPDVWVGTRAVILDGVRVGVGAIIGAGAVVTKDVSPYAVVGGAPAKKIKERFDEATINRLLASEWWMLEAEEIKANLSFFEPGRVEDFLSWVEGRK